MLVSFEGIDGSGKTSLSNLVCDRLRRAGAEVLHAREKGVLGSATARRVRDLTRDGQLLEMSPRAELFLNLAREAQQLEEVVRPALARGALCVADRSLHSLVALAVAGRGLPRAEVLPAVEVAASGTWPDLVVLVDVDPDLARLRKRVGKILDGRAGEAESRKGLAGQGLQVRIRRHLLREAAAHPDRWMVAPNDGLPLEQLADAVAAAVMGLLRGAPLERLPRLPRAPEPGPIDPTPAAVAERFADELERLAAREPALAAHLLSGIRGPEAHGWRVALAPAAPAVVARSLRGLSDPDTATLRRVLAAAVPADVAEGIGADFSGDAMRLRIRLVERAPAEVAAGLVANDTDEAWALRATALARGALAGVLAGLAGLDTARAWSLREEGISRRLWDGVGRSLAGVVGERAEAVRAGLAERDRLAALRSVGGVDGAAARALRERLFPHAPKRVLRSLSGLDADWTWPLRERGLSASKEALDSVDALDHPRAWALRAAGASLWPATAVSSLRHLALTADGRAVVARALATAPGSLPVLRNAHAAYALSEALAAAPRAAAPAWEESCQT